MRPFVAHVRHGCRDTLRELVLHRDIPCVDRRQAIVERTNVPADAVRIQRSAVGPNAGLVSWSVDAANHSRRIGNRVTVVQQRGGRIETRGP